MKETELAKHFTDYLSDYDLYFEVPWDGIVDIVARKAPINIAVEVKTTFSLKVIEQALSHRPYFHYSYVAVPLTKNIDMARRVCKDYGIGILAYDHSRGVMETIKPVLNRKAVFKGCPPDYCKRSIAGSQSGRMTAFKATCEAIVKYITRRGEGIEAKTVLKGIEHMHYTSFSSAKSSLKKYCDNGVIKDFRIENGKFYLNK